MLISEIYQSRQGEGLLTGTDSVFVRTSGCNLRCGFCDTPFASWSPTGQSMTVAQVVAAVADLPDSASHVVITGGEPMLPRSLDQLCFLLRQQNRHITIETAGTIFRELECDLMSISPKMSNSTPTESRAGPWRQRHERVRCQPDVVRQLIGKYSYQLKFVVDQPEDVTEIETYLRQIGPHDRSRVLLMPQGVDHRELAERKEWLDPICRERGFTLCERKHIQWYGNRRGT